MNKKPMAELTDEEFQAVSKQIKEEQKIHPLTFVARHKAQVAAAGIETPGGNGSSTSTVVMQCAADIEPKPLRWLWAGKIPAGKLTLLVGDPGLGKSVITLDIAARVSMGAPWPGEAGSTDPGETIILSAEDDPADTIIPRLKAIGAKLERIFIIKGVKRGKGGDAYFSLTEDLQLLEAVINDRVRLIIIDPISAYLGEVDSHINTSVRAVLAPLASLAGRTGAAVFGVSHLNKGAGVAIYRVQGSIAFTAAARAVWAVCKDLRDETGKRRLLLPVKCNLAADTEGLSYELTDAEGNASVSWGDSVFTDTAEALAHEAAEELGGIQEAVLFLEELLADAPVAASEVYKSARACAISEKTLKRAKKRLGVISEKADFSGGWIWRLSTTPSTKGVKNAEGGQEVRPDPLGPLGENWPPSGKDQAEFAEFEVVENDEA